MANETTQAKNDKEVLYKAEACISEICIGGEKGGKVKLKPADGFGVKVPDTNKELIAFVAACGSGTLLSADTPFAFPEEVGINSLLSLKQQHVKLLLTIDMDKKKIVSITVK